METIQLLRYETILHWLAFILYAASSILFVYSVVSRKEIWLDHGMRLALIGLLPHTVALAVRWYAVDHGPYLQKTESFSSLVWVSMVLFQIISYKVPRLKIIGHVVLPSCLLMMVLGLLSDPSVAGFISQALDHGRLEPGIYARPRPAKVPPTFRGIWFVLHITSDIVGVAIILIAFSTAVFYLLKKKRHGNPLYEKLPSLEALDAYSYRFTGFGFIAWTIMVTTGALWAEQSWGRYWGWDPIETWSLITWLLFGLYLHLRKFFHWQGEKAAWFMVVCVLFSLVTLFVIPFVMTTVHGQYFL